MVVTIPCPGLSSGAGRHAVRRPCRQAAGGRCRHSWSPTRGSQPAAPAASRPLQRDPSDTSQLSAARHDRAVVGGLRAVVDRALDLALPPTCAGCGAEGDHFCAACRPALEAQLERPGGVALGLPAAIPRPLLQLEWCSPVQRAPPSRPSTRLKYAGERRLAEPLGGPSRDPRWHHAGAGGRPPGPGADPRPPGPGNAASTRRSCWPRSPLAR